MDGVGKVAQSPGKGQNKSHWTISRVFTISRWLPIPGNTSGYAGEECTTYEQYCVSDGVHLCTYMYVCMYGHHI